MTTRPKLEEYAAQRRAAEEGNIASARTVAQLMMFCGFMRRLPISTEPPLAPYSLTGRLPSREPATETRRAAFEFCDQRTPEEISSATRLLRLAAAGGDLPAMMRLGEMRLGTEESLTMLEAAWKRGTLIALGRLAKAYAKRSKSSGAEGEDAIRALASRWLYVKLNESAFRQHSVTSEFVEALNADLDSKMERANPAVRSAALATARRMLSQNAECCSVP